MVLDNQNYTVLYWINQQVIRFFLNWKQFIIKKSQQNCFDHYIIFLEGDNHKEVDFREEKFTFTKQRIKT